MSTKKVKILILEDDFFDHKNIPDKFALEIYNKNIKNFHEFEIIISRLKFSLKKNFLIKFNN